MSRIPTSGAMRWVDVQNSFGGSNPIGINEYYRNSTYVPSSNINNNIPTSGQIEATDFRGADGFSGTTGSFIAGSSGGKLASYGYQEGVYGSNTGSAFTSGSGMKLNFHACTGFVGFVLACSTLAPSNLTNSASNQLCNKIISITSTVSGAVLSSPQPFQATSNSNQLTPASFGGGTNSTTNITQINNPPLGVIAASALGNTLNVSVS
jgi:hypothetical protein